MFHFYDYELDCRIEIIDVNNDTGMTTYRTEDSNEHERVRNERIVYWFTPPFESQVTARWNLLSQEAHSDWWEQGGW